MEGSAAPLGAERRRLAPLTGPTVWGSATPRRSPPSARSTGSSQARRLHTASVPRRLRGLSLSPVFRPRGPAPTPSQNTCAARATRTGSRRQSGAPPHSPDGSGGAGGGGGKGGGAREKPGLASRLGLAWYLPPTCGSRRPPRGPGVPGAGQRRVKERAPAPSASLPSPPPPTWKVP